MAYHVPRWSDQYNDDFYNEATQGALGEYGNYIQQPHNMQNRALYYSVDNSQQWIFAGLYANNQAIQQAQAAIRMANFSRVIWFQERQF